MSAIKFIGWNLQRARMRSLLRYHTLESARQWLIEHGRSAEQANTAILEYLREVTPTHVQPEWGSWYRE